MRRIVRTEQAIERVVTRAIRCHLQQTRRHSVARHGGNHDCYGV